MAIDKATVLRIAKLARIEVADEATDGLAAELNAILAWVEQLSEVDTEGVEPMTSVVEVTLPQRADVAGAVASREDLLADAPNAEDGFFTVPKVVE
ncbi:MAG: Asp-tRNA(Asn)/Glu-tRNA(Gln) amidotransferase subunit GatC [Alphaproteobacteria bacterium]|jgi:aspartyl-tRNA(Asn)/glutamyl-tRNA(Gln) amidotransferase subunit C|nr:Asp-tRNA(Asn)/Glu-tRNA(Gln) amidotransferase subunit GatC [Alphaproteobacteria bacterium]MDP6588528.1 Asp-tRNA(Asn)/Glu-tRNA(Gln) amidotransferase subunit GatC [Alphaproteobacteria bacterium]MDP6819600.1 Asp-tRNA(Asn)/Glu-tRNA(Gln) amidotransferase subunit GatC [Alphaproteobacteria bacterium]|tara:strand:- start:478 stop:765 length:288 start_codon:yes stop_codon:yes gene_type:complete